ncbi:DUF3813 family protein [Metabacillus idriensis]|uniref:DUF3813 family protein n=1 Tax=Metabacillus idriensis TaxID=324768 RepID=UPI001749F483|nr:DUF3813 family protein [Metabacillus idriensis]
MGNQLFQAARKAVNRAGEVLSGKMHDDQQHQNQYNQQHSQQNQYSQQHEHSDEAAKEKAEAALMSAFANASPAEQAQLSELQEELKK